jgi:hypothetical protein
VATATEANMAGGARPTTPHKQRGITRIDFGPCLV